MKQPLTPPPNAPIRLNEFDPRHTFGDVDKEAGERQTRENAAVIGELAYRLYA